MEAITPSLRITARRCSGTPSGRGPRAPLTELGTLPDEQAATSISNRFIEVITMALSFTVGGARDSLRASLRGRGRRTSRQRVRCRERMGAIHGAALWGTGRLGLGRAPEARHGRAWPDSSSQLARSQSGAGGSLSSRAGSNGLAAALRGITAELRQPARTAQRAGGACPLLGTATGRPGPGATS